MGIMNSSFILLTILSIEIQIKLYDESFSKFTQENLDFAQFLLKITYFICYRSLIGLLLEYLNNISHTERFLDFCLAIKVSI